MRSASDRWCGRAAIHAMRLFSPLVAYRDVSAAVHCRQHVADHGTFDMWFERSGACFMTAAYSSTSSSWLKPWSPFPFQRLFQMLPAIMKRCIAYFTRPLVFSFMSFLVSLSRAIVEESNNDLLVVVFSAVRERS